MKLFILIPMLLLVLNPSFAQVKQKPKEKPSQSQMDKAMEAAMKGMTAEEKAEMKKMMGEVMPVLQDHNNKIADYPEFASNKQLVPKKDMARINIASKKKLTQADMSSYATDLYNKIMTKGDAAEIAIIKKIIAQTPKANALGNAAILCMMQGHPQAAMALSMKAVQADPSNANWQNNMASLLTQYGYPEQAIPVLQKLKNQFPHNSTVLNNLGQAWFGLGELDSAKINIKMAGGLNPNHPEAKETEGVIEEVTGNTDKATDDYIEAMESSINPFTEMLIKNGNGQAKLDKIDFEKVKRSITIYEYFPKDWITIPALSDNVSGYENDMGIKNGYSKMFTELDATIETLGEASNREIDVLMEKGETEFAKTMMKENIKGLTKMSKTAVIVQKILQAYVSQWMKDYQKESSDLMSHVNAQRMEMTKSGKDDKCPDFDRKENEFLAYANPLIRDFHAKKIEEFRMWLNAFCTWIWYISGNPKNTVMTACIAWTGAISEMYENAIEGQYASPRSCVKQGGDVVKFIAAPPIPNFTCPSHVSMPVGAYWQELSNAVKNFDQNDYAVKANSANPIPNHTVAYGTDPTSIAEPGWDPFFKTANGGMSPGISDPNISNAAESAEILSSYMENRSVGFEPDLSSPGRAATTVTDDIVRVTNETNRKAAEGKDQGEWFKEYNNTRTDQQKAMETGDAKQGQWFKEFIKNKIEAQKAMEARNDAQGDWFREYQKNKTETQKATEARIQKSMESFKEILKKKLEAQKIVNKNAIDKAIADKIKQSKKSKQAQELLKKMMSADCKNVRNTKEIQKELFEKAMIEAGDNMEDVRANGLQPSLSTAMQVPGTFTAVKGFFN
jgi:tetratricopeptide (TPR) repeat protein